MHRTRVKICGIRTAEAAVCAVENGADALGFVFYPDSVRNISVQDAAAVISGLPPFVAKVGVFADKDMDGIIETAGKTGIDTIQLHGDETLYNLRFIKELKNRTGLSVLNAVRLKTLDTDALRELSSRDGQLKNWISGYVVDTADPVLPGGTGRRVELAVQADDELRKFLSTRVILAGGLDPSNVRNAVEAVQPYAVDVSSGVESEKGVKDCRLIREFLEAVRAHP